MAVDKTKDRIVHATSELFREQGFNATSVKQIVNQALRAGLGQLTSPGRHRRKRFKTRQADLGRCLIASLDNVSEALAIGEGEAFR